MRPDYTYRLAAYDALPKELRRAVAYAALTWDAVGIGVQYRQAVERMGRKDALAWMLASIRAADRQAVGGRPVLGFTKPARRRGSGSNARAERIWRRYGVGGG